MRGTSTGLHRVDIDGYSGGRNGFTGSKLDLFR
jgi:hypothetical protein